IAAAAETARPRVVRPRQRGLRYEINEWNDALLMLTDADGAVDRKLLEIDSTSFAVRREWVAHRPRTAIIAIQPFAQALLRLERVEGLHRLVLMRADGTETVVDFDDPAYCIELLPGQGHDASQVRVVHETP